MVTKTISVLGSTGSVGLQALDVAKHLGIKIVAIAANSNVRLLEKQVRRFLPELVAVADTRAARELKVRLQDIGTQVIAGEDAANEAAVAADVAVIAVSGVAGLMPTLKAINAGKSVALANKETLVCAGDLVMRQANLRRRYILPVDSEHSAIFQCMRGNRLASISKLILTASGGPFSGKSRDELEDVTPEMALEHPTWNMGKKITIDSATMMNKGLEFIEAKHLFSISPDKIEILVHRQSIVHSMVEFDDNSVIAQLGVPDMRLPIQYALTYPERQSSLVAPLDLSAVGSLTFEKPDFDNFPCLRLAIEAAKTGGTAGAILNGADEAAVEMFLNKRISFNRIPELIEQALNGIEITSDPSLEEIIDTDRRAYLYVRHNI